MPDDQTNSFARIKSGFHFIDIVKQLPHENRDALIQKILKNDAEFRRLMCSPDVLKYAAQNLPTLPAYLNTNTYILLIYVNVIFFFLLFAATMAECLWKTPSKTLNCGINARKRSRVDLVLSSLKKILADPTLFDWLFERDLDLRIIQDIDVFDRYLNQHYPGNTHSVAALRQAVKSEMIEKNKQASLAKTVALSRGGFFSELDSRSFPAELAQYHIYQYF